MEAKRRQSRPDSQGVRGCLRDALRFFILSPRCTGKPVRDALQTASLIYIAAVKIENNRITQVRRGSKNVNMG